MPFVTPASVSSMTGFAIPPTITISFVENPAVIGGVTGGTFDTDVHAKAVGPELSDAAVVLQPVMDFVLMLSSNNTGFPFTCNFALLAVLTVPL